MTATPAPAPPAGAAPALDPVSMVRSKAYLSALVLAGLLGIPISAIAYGFLALVSSLQKQLFDDWPSAIFDGAPPAWWPVPWLVLSGLLVSLTLKYLPGPGGHSPALGFQMGGGPPVDRHLPGIILASLATLSLGAVLGPEAPLIAIGGGLAALTLRLLKKDAPPMAVTVMASAGSFAAISTLLGSPLLGAFLIMEAAGIAGATLSLVALPGLLASGIGALVFIGLDSWTGLGTFSLTLTTVPPGVDPTVATLLWAIAVGIIGALLAWAVRWVGLSVRPLVHRNRVPVTVAVGALIGITAMAYQLITGQGFSQVLFSGQDALPELVANCDGLLGRDPRGAGPVQDAGLRPVPERLPGRPGVPGHVRRGGARHRDERAARHGPRARDRHGHRGRVLLDAAAAPHLGAARRGAARQRRAAGHPRGDRGRRRGVRHLHHPADARAAPAGRRARTGGTGDGPRTGLRHRDRLITRSG